MIFVKDIRVIRVLKDGKVDSNDVNSHLCVATLHSHIVVLHFYDVSSYSCIVSLRS